METSPHDTDFLKEDFTMGYHNKCKQTTRRNDRFPKFIKKLNDEIKRDEARAKLTDFLKKLQQKRAAQQWINIVENLLPQMKSELEELGPVPPVNKSVAVIQYAINFFDIVSHYQDMLEEGRINFFATPSLEETLIKLNEGIFRAGRHAPEDRISTKGVGYIPHWNLSKFGESVTEENVFFGPDIMQPQRPASYWVKLPKNKKNKISIPLSKAYAKGVVHSASPLIWATDAMVKYGGVRFFCVSVRKDILEATDLIIANGTAAAEKFLV